MPIAGRENRLSTSGSLETTQVWQKAVGYDPYAGEGEAQAEGLGPGEINSSAKGLFRLAQLTGHSSTIAPGACKRCGSVGHLYFQCRNMFTLRKEEKKLDQFVEDDDDEDEASPAL
ncbi:CAX-interacting protein 4 [Durusdinium trenchii]|uniref:CAX-interacting protein 4 n=1 Tax=Durusdinium trenchii TaxID=1381693 RepID=A0ABP0LMQ1_9DINO